MHIYFHTKKNEFDDIKMMIYVKFESSPVTSNWNHCLYLMRNWSCCSRCQWHWQLRLKLTFICLFLILFNKINKIYNYIHLCFIFSVVTGATDGIGKSYAKQLAKQGFNIILISRTQAKLDTVAKEIGNLNHSLLSLPLFSIRWIIFIESLSFFSICACFSFQMQCSFQLKCSFQK